MGRLWNEMMPHDEQHERQPQDQQAVAEREIDDAANHGLDSSHVLGCQ